MARNFHPLLIILFPLALYALFNLTGIFSSAGLPPLGVFYPFLIFGTVCVFVLVGLRASGVWKSG